MPFCGESLVAPKLRFINFNSPAPSLLIPRVLRPDKEIKRVTGLWVFA
jgi:hypothetical protein